MSHGNNSRWLIAAITVLGLAGIAGVIVIFLCVRDMQCAVLYAGILTTLIATVSGSILTVAGLKKLTVNTNSKMDELVEATKTIAYAAGFKAGHDDEKLPDRVIE